MNLSADDTHKLIKDLGSFRAKKRERAIGILSNRRNECMEPLLKSLSEEAIVYDMQSDFAHGVWRCRWILLLAILPLVVNLNKESDTVDLFFKIMVILSPALLMLLGIAISVPTPRFSALLTVLDNSKEPRVTSTLINLLEYRQVALYNRIEALVLDHLKAVNISDIPAFDVKQRKILCQMLFHQNSDEVNIITLLRALQQTGSTESLPAIKRMRREGHTEAVRQAARQCLAFIEYRQQEGNTRDTLLRASGNGAGKEELLRAANSSTDTYAETLLRVPEE